MVCVVKQVVRDMLVERDRPVEIDALSLEFAQPDGLCFDTEADAVNYFGKIAEDLSRWFSPQESSVCEGYKNDRVGICVNLKSGTFSKIGKCRLIIVPCIQRRHALSLSPAKTSFSKIREGYTPAFDSHCPERLVNFFIPNLVKLPEGVFPSTVWLVSKQEWAKCLRDLRVFVSVNVGSGLTQRPPEWELGVFGLRLSSDLSRRVKNNVIESGTKTVDNVERDYGQLGGQGLGDFDFVNFISGLRIDLHDSAVWVLGDKPTLDMLELVEMFQCPFDKQP